METSILVWSDILTISRSNLSIKVIGSRSRSLWSNRFSDCRTRNSFSMITLWYSEGHQGEGHFEVKVIPESNCKFGFLSKSGR